MGRNTTILILNDAFSEINKDPAGWWEATKQAALQEYLFKSQHKTGVEYGFGSHSNGFRVICEDHADYTNLIAVGGNHASSLLRVHNDGKHHSEQEQADLLLLAVQTMGYELESPMTRKLNDRLRRAYELACERLVALGEHPPTVDD